MRLPTAARDLVTTLALASVAAAVTPLLFHVLGLQAPAGSDPGMWEVSAMDLAASGTTMTAPLYPATVAGLSWLSGASAPDAAWLLAQIFFVAIAPLTYGVARLAGAARTPAVLAAFLGLGVPSAAAFSVQSQADGLAALVLLGCVGALLLYLRRGSWPSFVPLALATGLVVLVREHTFPVAGMLAAAATLRRTGHGTRLARAVVLVAVVWAAPGITGLDPGFPWQQKWFQVRTGGAVVDMVQQQLPPHVAELQPDRRAPYERAYEDGDQLAITLLNAQTNLARGWAPWSWIALGLLLACVLGGARRITFLAVLVCALPALVGWSQPRHVAIYLPVVATAWAAVTTRAPPRRRTVLTILAIALMAACQLEWHNVARWSRRHSESRAEMRDFGQALCAVLEPGAVSVCGKPRLSAYCPLPRLMPTMGSPMDWKMVCLNDMPEILPDWAGLEQAGWAPLDIGKELYPIYRLQPELVGAERPCVGSTLADRVHYGKTAKASPSSLAPPCVTPSPYTPPEAGAAPAEKGPPPRNGRGPTPSR